ncbi:MAG TPA: septum formation inhibitor Maf [Firmicutes bacterium]|nr:septum formation inhibitor Maf [Bacillota bacterium]
MTQLILASNSPRRRQLLQQMGLNFRVVTARVSEALPAGCDLAAGVMEIARRKARAVARREAEGLILGADTLVVLNGEALGKPAGPQEAYDMLTRLQGREHRVITGVALVDAGSGACLLEHEITRVWMRVLTPREIWRYVATGEPLDKAGAYGIQGKGALLVERIEGCYFNVVGLPLGKVAGMLERFGLDPWEVGDRKENGTGISFNN